MTSPVVVLPGSIQALDAKLSPRIAYLEQQTSDAHDAAWEQARELAKQRDLAVARAAALEAANVHLRTQLAEAKVYVDEYRRQLDDFERRLEVLEAKRSAR